MNMKRTTLECLKAIDANGGSIRKSVLATRVAGFEPRMIGALCVGRVPNCVQEGDTISITNKGRENLIREGITPSTEQAPIIKRDSEKPEKAIIQLILDRNDDVTITCKISPTFRKWLQTNGRLRSVVGDKGDSFARNWDCNGNSKYVAINLQELEGNSRGELNILGSYGLNAFIIKLAGADPNGKATIKYKGLISKEKLVSSAEDFRDRSKRFYYQYVKPIKISISLNTVE